MRRSRAHEELPDARHEAAKRYCEDMAVVEKLTGYSPSVENRIYAAHLHGWDVAAAMASAALAEEKEQRHAFMIKQWLEIQLAAEKEDE